MRILLLTVGILLIVWGGYLVRKEKQGEETETFQEVLVEQGREKGDFIRLLAANQDLKERLESVENKLDGMAVRLEQVRGDEPKTDPDYGEAAYKIAEMTKKKLSVEEMATSLHMGKGEVLFIQKMLEK